MNHTQSHVWAEVYRSLLVLPVSMVFPPNITIFSHVSGTCLPFPVLVVLSEENNFFLSFLLSENIKITLVILGNCINVTKMETSDMKANSITHC